MAKNDKPAAKGTDTGTGGQGAATSQDAVGSTASNPENSMMMGTLGPELVVSQYLADAKASTHGLAVSSNQDGFRRAGLVWSKQPTVVKLSDLTDDQINQLAHEPSLTVVLIDVPAEDDDQP